MSKKEKKKPEEKEVTETKAVKEPDGVPSEPETEPKDAGSEDKPCKKKKKQPEPGMPINPTTGRPYDKGPPGSWHG